MQISQSLEQWRERKIVGAASGYAMTLNPTNGESQVQRAAVQTDDNRQGENWKKPAVELYLNELLA